MFTGVWECDDGTPEVSWAILWGLSWYGDTAKLSKWNLLLKTGSFLSAFYILKLLNFYYIDLIKL